VPMFGDHPVELGLERPGIALLARLREGDAYRRLLPSAFPGETDPFTVTSITRALAAKRGEQLFFRQPLSFFRCHNGFNFSGATDFEGRREAGEPEFHNTGLY